MKLSQQAKTVFERVKDSEQIRYEALEDQGFDQSMIARAGKELEGKGLVEIIVDEEVAYTLTKKGKTVMREGSPEFRLVEILEDGPKTFSEINIPADIAVGKAREKDWIEIDDGEIHLTEQGNFVDEDEVLQQLKNEEFGPDLVDRGLIERITETAKTLKLTEKGKQVKLGNIEEQFNVSAEASMPQIGRKHFYKEVIDYARDQWREMGFEEMQGDFVVSSFLNFDALYTPQDHPARELHDTFFMDRPGEADISKFVDSGNDRVEHVRQTHENGWTTGSTGWGYDWSRDEAKRNVLRTHTTSVSAQKLSELDEKDLPAKFFTVSRNFRNETVDRTHLAEFYQTDGIVVGEDLSFKNLKGYLTKFFEKMGYDEVRLIPSYYPYTEMSVEIQVYDDEEDEWMGLGGAGMFRPEVVKPLIGKEVSVLAWGLGVGRIAAGAAGIDDIWELYRNDKKLLEKTPTWRPE